MESIVDYLRVMFDGNIRAIVPQLALSAGTAVACACREMRSMGKHSSLGPIDPQVEGLPAHGILAEFDQAYQQIQAEPGRAVLWREIVAQYRPTLIGDCERAIKWTEEMTKGWLITGMFEGDTEGRRKANRVLRELTRSAHTLAHNRHIFGREGREDRTQDR